MNRKCHALINHMFDDCTKTGHNSNYKIFNVNVSVRNPKIIILCFRSVQVLQE